MKNFDNTGNQENAQQSPTKQAANWLKSRQDKLINNLADKLGDSPDIPLHWLPNFLRKAVAKDMIQDLIIRLDESVFDQAAATKKMLTALNRGASVKSISVGIDLMLVVITELAQQELAGQPALQTTVIEKSRYFATLIKSTLANAMIEYQKAKPGKR